jgi:tRNA A-37 threonylcarbamoyl transferase component Bud32
MSEAVVFTSADKQCFTDAGLSIMSEAVVFTSADKRCFTDALLSIMSEAVVFTFQAINSKLT